MGKSNISRQSFYGNGSWVAPAGVYAVNVQGNKYFPPCSQLAFWGGVMDKFGRGYCMGNNARGNFGNNGTTSTSSPTLVLGGLTFQKLFGGGGGEGASNQTSMGLTNQGVLYGWGHNFNGQLGIGTSANVSSPTLVLGSLIFSDFSLDNTAASALALTPGGQAYGWGINGAGQAGIGNSTPTSSPVLVVGGLTFQKVITNGSSSAGIDMSGNLYMWGFNNIGQLGTGNTTSVSSPVLVVGGLVFADVLIAASSGLNVTVFGLTTSGDLYAWGSNSQGMLGSNDSSKTVVSSPVLVVGGLKWQKILAAQSNGWGNASAITTAGAIYSWGANSVGQLGINSIAAGMISSPTLVVGGLTWRTAFFITDLFSGSGFVNATIGITTDGTAYGWGHNQQGQIGDGTTSNRSSPVQVAGGLKWKHMWTPPISGTTAANNAILGMTTDGRLWGWGVNDQGVLGDGTTTNRSSPAAVVGGLAGNPQDSIVSQTVPVIPGSTYSVLFSTTGVSFGGFPVANWGADSLTLTWET